VEPALGPKNIKVKIAKTLKKIDAKLEKKSQR
jgi:hypothetical protein